MRPALNLIASVMLALSSALTLGSPAAMNSFWSGLPSRSVKETRQRPTRLACRGGALGQNGLSPLSPIGLTLLEPYTRGKIPVVFVHGFGNRPDSWARMIECLESDPAIRDHCQFWTFGFATGEPLLYSASLLRQALARARQQYDAGRTDPAFDRMVLVGYSMGGILARTMAGSSQSILWDEISNHPFETLKGPLPARQALRESFFFTPVPEVSRVICIATPHRGSQVDQGALHWLGSQLNPPMDQLRKIHEALVASNDPSFFHKSFREKLESSIDQLEWEHPRLLALLKLAMNPRVLFHSIIADLSDAPGTDGTDGVVPYVSAHLDGASSERIVRGGHLCQANPLVIEETARILREHTASSLQGLATPAGCLGPVAEVAAGLPSLAIRASSVERAVTHWAGCPRAR